MAHTQPQPLRQPPPWRGISYPTFKGKIMVSLQSGLATASSVSSTTTFLYVGPDRISTGEYELLEDAEAMAEWRRLTVRRDDPAYEPPRTALGAKLRQWRARFIESGGHMLNSEEIAQEVAERRGGVESEA